MITIYYRRVGGVRAVSEIVWIGVRESDISDCANLFSKSITIFGSNEGNNHSYCSNKEIRIDHNEPASVPNIFWKENMYKCLNVNPDTYFLYYNPLLSFEMDEELQNRSICVNSMSILLLLNNKARMREIVKSIGISIVPFQWIQSERLLPKYQNGFVLQQNCSSGGYGTYLYSAEEREQLIEQIKTQDNNFISPYIPNSIPVNQHFIISDNQIIPFPGSVQIVYPIGASPTKLLFMGSDYIAYQSIDSKITQQIIECGHTISLMLQKLGYRGVIGYDYLITLSDVLFLEANGRFQASTHLLNTALHDNNYISMQEMHLLSFKNDCRNISLSPFKVPYSFVSYLHGTFPSNLHCLTNSSRDIYAIYLDGYQSEQHIQSNAYMFKVVFNTNVMNVFPNSTLKHHVNLLPNSKEINRKIINRDLLSIKISLLNQGVVLAENAKQKRAQWKDGVFDSFDIKISDKLYINCPNNGKLQQLTPWVIDIDSQEKLSLSYLGTPIISIEIDEINPYANRKTSNGVYFSDASFLATDRLRINHCSSCLFKLQNKGCNFCDMPKKTQNIALDDIFEIIDFYEDNNGKFRHYLIGGGSQADEYTKIIKIAKYIRKKTQKPIYAMCLPITEDRILHEMYAAGVTEIAFNIEIFDPTIARKHMPGKGEIPREKYFVALEKATKYWGKQGNVRSLIIVGLEPENNYLKGIERLSSIGVMPIISVFRPLINTPMYNMLPPNNDWLRNIYYQSEDICSDYGLHLGPDCVFCQNNTLSLPLSDL
jgi:predicted DNA-binding transcriptional regulator